MDTDELIERIQHIEAHFGAKFELQRVHDDNFYIASDYVKINAERTIKGWVYGMTFTCTLYGVSHIPDAIAETKKQLEKATTPKISAQPAEGNP